jgi:7,8-didemethyl-8-hydroxy-5-deazariboflavin synthase CofG subunit
VTYSRKVFIPLTELCRDVCHYCTYAKTPRRLRNVYLSPEQVLDIARAGQAAGCHEALFTLGDKPELRYRAARDALATLGFASTLDYLRAMAELVRRETGLLPHLNAGVMSHEEFAACARSRLRWASCWNPQHRGSHRKAVRTTAHPTRHRLSACCRYAPPARRACRSPPAC